MIIYVLIVVVIIPILWAVITYNRLISLRAHLKNAWAGIDVQLKRRYDLIPNLVQTAKGYLKHEREVLENVIKARTQAISASGVQDQAKAENF
ncbi:LemA family protein, partial [bacterium]|nr:LemA family protein [bacterium]